MSFLSDIGDFASKAVSTVVNTAETVVGDGAKVALGVGEAAFDTIGGIIKNPTELLNPFELVKGTVGNLIHDIGGQFASGGSSASGNGSFGTLDKLGSSISSLQSQLQNLDPNSPTYQADVTKLSIQLQMAQQQFTQIANTESDLQKKSDDVAENVIGNLR